MPALAGSCDCKTEVSNASAIVLQSCSKEWAENQCTLREIGAKSDTPELHALFDKYGLRIIGDESTTLQSKSFNEMQLKALVAAQIFNGKNEAFLADVFGTIDENARSISQDWGENRLDRFKGRISVSAVSNRCLYAQLTDKTENFYLNFNRENAPCDAWRAFQ
jgi:hypothetical protein